MIYTLYASLCLTEQDLLRNTENCAFSSISDADVSRNDYHFESLPVDQTKEFLSLKLERIEA